ncbi:Orexin receptor type 1 [Mizuhopecten yessoensis]|uniref:Orexin receptor type 1 n=1 Tax=Mizuhopecten yessoensis TaxID=6573 RepID=A0A210R224_MIZYE|nr:Orexin receptor type 1 [Mizuhopecten yessoensis]
MSNTTGGSYLSTYNFDFTTQNTISELSTGSVVSTDGQFMMTNANRTLMMVPVHTPTYIYVWISVVNVAIFLAGFLGNIMVIIAVAKVKNMRTPTNFCLVNLSMADVLVLGVCQTSAFLEFFAEDRWLLGNVLCEYEFYHD